MTVTPPTLTDQPATPEWWECRAVNGKPQLLGPAYHSDPAELTDLGVAALVERAVDEVAAWHRIAETSAIPTPPWEQLLSPDTFSGHKLHIACASLADVRAALAVVFEVCWRAGLGVKAATAADVLGKGKGVVIYLPRRGTVDRDVSLVAAALAGYAPAAPVTVPGDVQLAGALWWRHEFGGADPGYDVDSYEYRRWYVPAAA